MSRYSIHPHTTILLEPRYCGSIGWYAAMAAHEHCIVDYSARYDKRHKLTHRTTIADVNGPLSLTVPLSHPAGSDIQRPLTWRDMYLSTHGEWWNVHRVALESAYGRTPYFEYYIDRFLPALTPGVVERLISIENLDKLIDHEVRKLLDLPPDIDSPRGNVIDMRHDEPVLSSCPAYYQVRSAKLGFIANLSILDLLFNIGPEACLWLRKCINKNS